MALAALPAAALATTLNYNLTENSDIAGATSNSPSAFCASGSSCPGGSPAFPLSTSAPLSGTISVDTTASTLSFDLTLTQDTSFGGLTLDMGSTLSAGVSGEPPISVSITSSTKGGVTTDTILLPVSGTYTASADLLLSSGFTQTLGTPIVSGLDCSLTVGGSGSCAFVLGTPVSGSDALQVSEGSNAYDGVLSISTNLTPVPLPASAWLLLAGLACLCFARPRAHLA